MNEHIHEWKVFSTALATIELLVCCDCGATGAVPEPTLEEWKRAFHAPSENYDWNEPERVRVLEGLTTADHPEHDGIRVLVKAKL